jgi:hypothetical protein
VVGQALRQRRRIVGEREQEFDRLEAIARAAAAKRSRKSCSG